MQKILLSIIAFAILSNLAYSQPFSGGTGTEADPYRITSKKDMEALSDSVYKDYNWTIKKYFLLVNDITDSVRTGIPSFKGNFNGNNKKITVDLDFNGSYVALFSHLTNAMVYDLSVDGFINGFSYVGGIAAKSENSNITNCTNYANIGGFALNNAGGIIGAVFNSSIINNCTNYGKVDAGVSGYHIGGIVGMVYGNTNIISNSKNYGEITSHWLVGGIVGSYATLDCYVSNSHCYEYEIEFLVSNCFNSGSIIGVSSVGGIIGNLHHSEIISHCVNIGTIKGDYFVGGIVGGGEHHPNYCGTGDIYYCINSGLVIGKNSVGGIIGFAGQNGAVKYCMNTGVILPSDNDFANIGAIIGAIQQVAVIENCYYDKQMCIYGGINNNDAVKKAEGRLTKELIGNNLLSKLGTDDWIYYDSLYPMLKDLEGEIISKIAASPAYLDDINEDYDKHNKIRQCFYINLENDVIWTNAFDKVEFFGNEVYLTNIGEDTLYAGIGDVKKTIPVIIKDICNGRLNSPTKFIIWADTHKLISPTATNFPLPIYITADRNIWRYSNFTIDSLIIEIDKYIFYLKSVDNGNIENYNDGLILLRNIKLPDIKANEKTLLLNLFGDMLLYIDSSDISLKSVVFIEALTEEPELIDGYITLNICEDGGERLLSSGNIPSIIISDNPLTNILKTEIKVLEVGNYSLEIVDILGKTEIVKEWSVSKDDVKEFAFEIQTIMYGNGSYFLVLNTPTEKYSEKFIIKR